jgi:DNA-binding XRE family transcriptional regulator
MAHQRRLENELRIHRIRQGWSQMELARRCRLSRAEISAIETGRLFPSTVTALALAAALACPVENLFPLHHSESGKADWAWPPRREPCRYWQAKVGATRMLYPAESTESVMVPHDGNYGHASCRGSIRADPALTLVLPCCSVSTEVP